MELITSEVLTVTNNLEFMNYKGILKPVNKVNGVMVLCIDKGIIRVYRVNDNTYNVCYGLQVKRLLSYNEMCGELGVCMMHYKDSN